MKSEKPKKTAIMKGGDAKAPAVTKPSARVDRSASKQRAPQIPPILLEGDTPVAPAKKGPGRRYDSVASAGEALEEEGVLPEAYGTGRLAVTARDPYWLFARWDFTRDQLQQYNSLSVDGHLVLRIYKNGLEGEPASETEVHPESRNWFVNVGEPGTLFLGELGYYKAGRVWKRVAVSGGTMTPPDTISEDQSVTFETLPSDLDFGRLVEMVSGAVSRHVPLIEALQKLRESGHAGLPDRVGSSSRAWSPEQTAALGAIVRRDAERRVWVGSLEITELIRRQFHAELSSMAAAQFSLPSSWSGGLSSETSLSSPFGGGGKQRSFWFNVNAELIIYGSTEPDAKVTIGGRPIQLRPDGSFSYRFALPDGHYDLPAAAGSADGVETRLAGLKFTRSTDYRGEVGKHPQDPALKPPLTSSIG